MRKIRATFRFCTRTIRARILFFARRKVDRTKTDTTWGKRGCSPSSILCILRLNIIDNIERFTTRRSRPIMFRSAIFQSSTFLTCAVCHSRHSLNQFLVQFLRTFKVLTSTEESRPMDTTNSWRITTL